LSERRVKMPVETTSVEDIVRALEELGARWAVIGRMCTDEYIEIEVLGRRGVIYLPCWLPNEMRSQLERLLATYGGEHRDYRLP